METIQISLSNNQITIQPPKLMVLAGENLQFVANQPVSVSFSQDLLVAMNGNDRRRFSTGPEGTTVQIDPGFALTDPVYPYEVTPQDGDSAGSSQNRSSTAQGELHPASGGGGGK